ncbi:HD-GYP domain-containing protein [Streptomyces sp. JJ36]|uniref:HD-GYP domain-containing protein n=1 Tax=Streptomyces sp. JJ36 TaxID=2736645 RepID=UPI001F433BA5|nr:HD domain-containing protein [Streptomyces sp. JJ36]MCF6523446.1 metal-dependent phosphohydrolase [Streptomyces sp. JJ36]
MRGGGTAAAAVRAAGGLVAVVGVAVTLGHGLPQPRVALAFGLVVALGEALRVRLPGVARPAAPLGAAGALGYALLDAVGGRPVTHGVPEVVAVTAVATLAGLTPHVLRGTAGRDPLEHAARRVLTAGFAATCCLPLGAGGPPGAWTGGPYAVLLPAVLLLTGLCDAVLRAVAAARSGRPFPLLLPEEIRATVGIVPAVAATGVVPALAVGAAGLWALPVCCVPLLLTHLAFRRHAAVRATYRQTVASLARATEIAGHTPHGHARRVAVLSRAVGRELGLSGPRLTVLEYAALMHDIGQLSLPDPVEGGATEPLAEDRRRRIALLGGAVVRRTGVPEAVAVVVERQADPYREQPVTARILRVANAYAELTAAPARGGAVAGPLHALERLRLGGARDFDPGVVAALSRVVTGGGPRRPPGRTSG